MKQKNESENEMKKKLEYIGLDLDNVPETLKVFEQLNFKTTKSYDENKYKQYRYIPIKDIEILLSPTNRLNSIEEKYSKASDVYSYLVPDTEENKVKHEMFLQMLNKIKIEDIEKVEKEQKELNSKMPFKIKYPGNYLWQIYYSEGTDRYFMLLPIEDSDYSTFFFLLKKQLEKRKTGKIFAPISYLDYSRGIFTKSEIEDIENYLWLFTKDWPSIYEVHDKTDKISFQIIGETEVYENIKTPYKITLNNKIEADEFFKVLKALFIMQTQLSHYYKFDTNINNNAELEFYFNNQQITYKNIGEFINIEYAKIIKNEEEKDQEIIRLNEKIKILHKNIKQLEEEYLAKEKQISTYLECKRTFFGKVKYLIKYSKKTTKKNLKHDIEDEEEELQDENLIIPTEVKGRYTLEDLVEKCKEYEVKENKYKKLIMDINAIKLRIKNISKKIENATKYIEEIDKHKKSIFDFWKYTNKDEISSLPEGEEETLNVEPQIKRLFSYKDDMEKLGEYLDTVQRKELTKEELNSIYVSTTNVLNAINSLIVTKETSRKEIENSLKKIKEELLKTSEQSSEFDIFGGLIDDDRKIKKIANKAHREISRDLSSILNIDKTTKVTEYKFELDRIIKNLKSAIEKIKLNQNIVVYKAIEDEDLNESQINIFNLDLEKEIEDMLENSSNSKINLYRLEIEKGKNVVGFTNNVFFDNKNKTLPIGMDLSSKVLVYDNDIKDNMSSEPVKTFKVAYFEENKNELSKLKVKTINVYE